MQSKIKNYYGMLLSIVPTYNFNQMENYEGLMQVS